MIDSEYHRLTKLKRDEMTSGELRRWNEEFAQRNFEHSVRIRQAWLVKTDAERAAITRAAAPVIALGWAVACRIKSQK